MREEQLSLLWLSSAEVTADRAETLLEEYGSAAAVREEFRKGKKLPFARKEKEVLSRIVSDDALSEIAGKLEEKRVHLLFRGDAEYPEPLTHIQDPPYVLYYAGKLSALTRPCIGVVGTRKPSAYGREMAREIAAGLSKAGITVVSGLAYGIDAEAHRAVLDADGATVGVMGSGINVPYPAEHLELMREIAVGKGLVLTEYPLDAEPKSFHFPYRNRIISGLSFGIVFVEGRIKSGGMHTVTSALTQGREVFAVPGQVGTAGAEGPNAVLREGARIITCARDLLEDIGFACEAEPEPEEVFSLDGPSETQKQIALLLKTESLTISDMADKLGIPEEKAVSEIGIMEILGTVEREAGNRFRLPIGGRHRRKS